MLVFGSAAPVMAQQKWSDINKVCVGEGKMADVATIQGFQCLVANILNVVLTIFAFVGFAMFIYAGVVLLLSGGQPSNFENAKNTLVYAVLGFVLAISSFVIINLISYFTGINSFMTIKFLDDTPPTEGL